MTGEPENFENIRRLLAWKRHERPPRGFFRRFPEQVATRIEGETQFRNKRWWNRWWNEWDAKPAFACCFGGLVAAVLVAGVAVSEQVEDQPLRTPSFHRTVLALTPHDLSLVPVEPNLAQPVLNPREIPSSLNPVITSIAPHGLFDGSGLKVQTARFQR